MTFFDRLTSATAPQRQYLLETQQILFELRETVVRLLEEGLNDGVGHRRRCAGDAWVASPSARLSRRLRLRAGIWAYGFTPKTTENLVVNARASDNEPDA